MVPLVILKVAPYGKHASIKSVSLSLIDYRAHTHHWPRLNNTVQNTFDSRVALVYL